jgi:CspA family cold shock protein
MPKGTIKRLMDRGFGFIKTEDETDLFFHRNDLEGVEFNSLREGQEVEFEKVQGRDGRPAAAKVRLIEAQASDDSGEDQNGEDQGGEDQGGEDQGGGEDEVQA